MARVKNQKRGPTKFNQYMAKTLPTLKHIKDYTLRRREAGRMWEVAPENPNRTGSSRQYSKSANLTQKAISKIPSYKRTEDQRLKYSKGERERYKAHKEEKVAEAVKEKEAERSYWEDDE